METTTNYKEAFDNATDGELGLYAFMAYSRAYKGDDKAFDDIALINTYLVDSDRAEAVTAICNYYINTFH
jgi:hypothetical protein